MYRAILDFMCVCEVGGIDKKKFMLLKVRYYTYLPGQLEVWLGEGLWPAAYSNSSLTDG